MISKIIDILTKTLNDLKWIKTTWNDLQRARIDSKQPRPSKKKPETTSNNLEQEKNDMRRSSVSKKRSETIYNKQGATWNNLHRSDSNLMEPSIKKQSTGRLQCHKEAIKHFRWLVLAYSTVTSNAIPGFYNSFKCFQIFTRL